MNEQVKICLVGAGRAAKVHANSLIHHVPDANLVAIVDPDLQTLHTTADTFGIHQRFTSLEEALNSIECDAVVITTPTFTHVELSVMAASHKKHIFLEKPMALDLRGCDEIIRATNENGVLLQLGFMRRFSPEFVSAAQRIEAGEIGQPLMIKSLTHGPGLPPPWALNLSTSNGNLAEVNSHDWDTIRWLMGAEYERVYTEVANLKGKKRGVMTEHFYDHALVTIRFENGALGNISSVCPCDYGYDARVEIIGEKGILQIGELKSQAIVICTNRDQGLITPIFRTWPERFEWGYIYEMKHFISCIKNGEQPKVGGIEGRWAVAGVLAATKSFLEARPVYLAEVLQR